MQEVVRQHVNIFRQSRVTAKRVVGNVQARIRRFSRGPYTPQTVNPLFDDAAMLLSWMSPAFLNLYLRDSEKFINLCH